MSAIATLHPPTAVSVPLDDDLFEIVNGQRVEPLPMSAYAAMIASRLHAEMYVHTARRSLGTVICEALFILDKVNDIRRRPDVAFVSKDRWPLDRPISETGDWEVVPNLAIEVVSLTDLFQNVLAKKGEYFRLEADQVWIIAPADRQIHVYSSPTNNRILTSADLLDGGTLLPDFRIPIGPLFDPLPQGSPINPGTQP